MTQGNGKGRGVEWPQLPGSLLPPPPPCSLLLTVASCVCMYAESGGLGRRVNAYVSEWDILVPRPRWRSPTQCPHIPILNVLKAQQRGHHHHKDVSWQNKVPWKRKAWMDLGPPSQPGQGKPGESPVLCPCRKALGGVAHTTVFMLICQRQIRAQLGGGLSKIIPRLI